MSVIQYQDDIVIAGSTMEEHDRRLYVTLKVIKEPGLKLNKAMLFQTGVIVVLGHLFNEDGMGVDAAKVKAIQDMPVPTGTTELRRVLGMANYLGQYIPRLVTVTKSMNNLLHKDVA